MQRTYQPRDSKRTAIHLSALVSIFVVVAFVSGLVAPPSEETQVGSALGCRANDQILILKLQPDGKVRWPDGSENTIEESKLLVPSWCSKQESPVLAILADKDTPMSFANSLLAVAQELGLRRAILATYEGTALRVLSDEAGKTTK